MSVTIGIVGGLMNQTNGITGYGVNAAYLEYFRQYGDVLIIDPGINRVLDIDLLVLPGGADINTQRYGQVPSIFTGKPNPFLEWFDENVLPKYIDACKEEKVAIYGTCRGSQSLAAYFGIPLHQHIEQNNSTKYRGELTHYVRLIRDNQPEELLDVVPKEWYGKRATPNSTTGLLKINSIHHQGFMYNDFKGSPLLPLALNVEKQSNGLVNVEFFRHKTLNIFAGQHHNEECYDEYSYHILNHMIDRVKSTKNIQVAYERN